jgi:ubiquinone/menaquinone biosynthesis C-methylase UbiE
MTTEKSTWTGERLETFVFNENTIEHLHRYAIATELAASKTVLDIASGEGYGTNMMAEVAAEVVGVDIDEETIANAKNKYEQANLSFKTGSADRIPCESGYFDLVVSFETIEHHDRHHEMMAEIKRVLKPGGLLLISSPDKLYYSDLTGYKNPFHVKELYQKEFESLLAQYFKYTSYCRQKNFIGSLIVPRFDDAENDSVKMYDGDYGELTNNDMGGQFLVALASDNELPQLKLTLFNGQQVVQKQIDDVRDQVMAFMQQQAAEYFGKMEKEAADRTEKMKQQALADIEQARLQEAERLQNTRDYRLGNALMVPLRTIKKLLHA